jgi:hypothetical protein
LLPPGIERGNIKGVENIYTVVNPFDVTFHFFISPFNPRGGQILSPPSAPDSGIFTLRLTPVLSVDFYYP